MAGHHFASGDHFKPLRGESYRIELGADADTTYSVSTTDIVRVGASTLSQNRTYTIDPVDTDVDPISMMSPTQPPHDGCVLMMISRTEDVGSHTLSIKDGVSGVVLVVLSAAGPSWATIVFHGSNWHVFQQG